MMDFTGKVYIVTGASTGIGLQISMPTEDIIFKSRAA